MRLSSPTMRVTNTADEYCLLSVMPTLLRITPRRTTTVFKKLEAQQPTLHIPFPANKAPYTENFSDAHTILFLTWYESTSDIAFCINELEEDDIEMRRAVDLGQAVFDMRNPHKILTYLPTCAHAHFLALYTTCLPERRKIRWGEFKGLKFIHPYQHYNRFPDITFSSAPTHKVQDIFYVPTYPTNCIPNTLAINDESPLSLEEMNTMIAVLADNTGVHFIHCSYTKMGHNRRLLDRNQIICLNLGDTIIFFDPENGVVSFTGANASHQFKQWLTQEITLGALSYIVNEPDDATVYLSRKLKYLEIGTYQESKCIKYYNMKQGSRHYFCDACGKREHDPEQLSSCSKCKKVRYCNTTCQKQHWYAHKKECKTYTSPFPKMAPAC